MLKSQRGVTLTVNGEVISDQVHVVPSSQSAVSAWVFNPEPVLDEFGNLLRDPGSERYGRLVKVSEVGGRLEGINPDTGEAETWVISKGKGCVGCN